MPGQGKPITKANAKAMAARSGARGPSLVNFNFRETIRQILDGNSTKMQRWLNQVAEGDEEKGILADPARALDILAKLAEYAAPKMTRIAVDAQGNEVAPDAGKAQPVTRIAIQFVDGRAPSAIDVTPTLAAPAQAEPEPLAAIPARPEPAATRIKRERQTQ